MDHGNFMGSNQSMEHRYGLNPNSKGGAGQINGEPQSNFNQFEASAFKSTPRSNQFSNSSVMMISPNAETPPQAMRVATGFNPKIPKESPVISYVAGNSAFLPAAQHYVSDAPKQQEKEQHPPPPQEIKKPVTVTEEEKAPEPEEEGDESSDSHPEGNTKGKKKAKKERNRTSARECRKRKKQYVESLENQVKQLTEQLSASKKEIEVLKYKMQQGYTDTCSVIKDLNEKRGEILNGVKKIIEEGHPDKMLFDYLLALTV
jgi:hypothetical protein